MTAPTPPAPPPPGPLACRPLVPTAAAFVVGVAMSAALPHVATLWLAIAAVLLPLAWRARDAVAGTALLLAAVASAGVAVAQVEAFHYPAAHLARFSSDDRRLAEVRVTVNESPRVVQIDFGQRHPLPPKQVFLGDVTAVRTWSGWTPARGRVLVQLSEIHPGLAAGETVRVLATLDRPAPAANPGQFDWAAYYRQQRVLVSLHVPHARNLTVLSRTSPGWRVDWEDWTRRKLADGFTADQSLDAALLRALVVGDPDPELRDVQEDFRATGTSHELAVSGMHVAIVGGVVFLALRLLRLRPRTAWYAAMAVVLLYGAAALPNPPVVRAVLTWLAVGVVVLGRRRVELLQLLAGVVLAMLIYSPNDLFNAGFQLSFGTVLGLVLLTKPVADGLGATVRPDPLDGPRDGPMFHVARRIDAEVVLIFAAAVVAWVVSMPMVAEHFAQLNPWAVFAGIALLPVVVLALVGGLLKIVCTAAWPGMAATFAWLAERPVIWMREFVAELARLPSGDVPLPAPPAWLVVLFYATLLVAVFHRRSRSVRVLSKVAFGLSVLALLALPYRTPAAAPASADELRLTLLSVGAGQCCVVEPPGHRVTMVDAGSLTLADPVRRCVGPYLRQRGLTAIDTVFVTHPDTDHYGGVGELVQAYDVHEVLVSQSFEREVARNAVGREFLQTLRDCDRPPRRLAPGQTIPLGTDTSVDVLWPPPDLNVKDTNDTSLVLRLTHAGRRVLFTGDIQADAENALLAHPEQLKADVLIAPHHGSSEPTTAAFLKAVSPQIILSSNDRSLTQKQVTFGKLCAGTPLYRTNATGAVTVRIDGSGKLKVESQTPLKS